MATATKVGKVVVPELNLEALEIAIKDFAPGEAKNEVDRGNFSKFKDNPHVQATILLGSIALLTHGSETHVLESLAHSYFVLGTKYAKALRELEG